jgi:hypothetical protein
LNKIGVGDNKAIEIIYRHYQAAVFAFVRLRVRDAAEAKEIRNDNFMIVFSKAGQCNASVFRLSSAFSESGNRSVGQFLQRRGFRKNPNVDRIFLYQKLKHAVGVLNQIKALSTRIRLIAQLRQWRPDVSILAKSSYDLRGLNFAS